MVSQRLVTLLTVLIATSLLNFAIASAEPVANQQNLGFLAPDSYGDTYSESRAINDSGQVAGVSTNEYGRLRAILFEHGVVRDLGVIDDGYESEARDINNSGQVVGFSYTAGSGTRAFLYSNGVLGNLGVLPGGYTSEAVAINDAGQVTGYSDTPTSYAHAFLYSDGAMTDLGSLPGGDESYATAINNAGQVAGYAMTATDQHAFLYSAGTMIDLGTLGGSGSTGHGINEAGDVVGSSLITGNTGEHAFLYHAGAMQDLGTLGGTFSVGMVVNEAGDVGGYSLTAGNTAYHAFLYTGGTMIDLGTPGYDWGNVVDINEDGDVLGYETDPATSRPNCWIYSNGVKRSLGSLGGDGCWVSDWNSFGIVAGTSKTSQAEDRAFVTSCRLQPASGCDSAPKGSLLVKDNAEDKKDKLNWKWTAGSAMSQSDLGDPVVSTGYRFCVYDATAGADSLVAALAMDPGDSWLTKDPKGLRYKGSAGAKDGVTKVQMKTGGDGASKIQLVAKGVELPTPTPYSATEFFDSDSHVTIQLVRDDGPKCWSSEFSTATRNTGSEYQARLP